MCQIMAGSKPTCLLTMHISQNTNLTSLYLAWMIQPKFLSLLHVNPSLWWRRFGRRSPWLQQVAAATLRVSTWSKLDSCGFGLEQNRGLKNYDSGIVGLEVVATGKSEGAINQALEQDVEGDLVFVMGFGSELFNQIWFFYGFRWATMYVCGAFFRRGCSRWVS